jgi:hypothetical protein
MLMQIHFRRFRLAVDSKWVVQALWPWGFQFGYLVVQGHSVIMHDLRGVVLLPWPLNVLAALLLAAVCLVIWPIGLLIEGAKRCLRG